MSRRSSSNRWSRPATRKQIAALKTGGKYDGKYYSMGRASQAIGGSGSNSWAGVRSSSSHASASAQTKLTPSRFGPAEYLSRPLLGSVDLDSLLQSALGAGLKNQLASSEVGPTSILSELLGVPDDLDSLVQVALGGSDPGSAGAEPEDGGVESVLYTIRSGDSDPAESRIVVEAEVTHNSAFTGKPSVQIRFIGAGDQDAAETPDTAFPRRMRLAYRPTWTPSLVRTPPELAEQMRVHWGSAVEELEEGVDPRLSTFLAGVGGMEAASVVLVSSQSTASKFIHLQGILDPGGPIQFQGLGLDAATFADQIRQAHEGDDDALDWLAAIQDDQVLTSFAEVTGASHSAEADFRLARWRKQAFAVIEAVTMSADDAGFDFSPVRTSLSKQAEIQTGFEELRVRLAEDSEYRGRLDEIEVLRERSSPSEYELVEDWFFEEMRIYLLLRLRRSLPAQFTAALTPPSAARGNRDTLADEARGLVGVSSTDPHDYSHDPGSRSGWPLGAYGGFTRGPQDAHRLARIVQAVRRAAALVEASEADDLGTLLMAREVLAYAQWKRDEVAEAKQLQKLGRRRSAIAQRANEARKRAERAKTRGEQALKQARVMPTLDVIIQKYVHTLAVTKTSMVIDDPIPESVLTAANARLAEAQAREVSACERFAAAEKRQGWADSELALAATAYAKLRLGAEHDAAVAEQSDARAERDAAQQEERATQEYLTLILDARRRFEDRMRPVREANLKRLHAEAEHRRETAARREEEERRQQAAETEHRRETAARREEERRQQAEEQHKRWAYEQAHREAADRLQEQTNQGQQDRARTAKDALASELVRLLELPPTVSFWRRKTHEVTRKTLEQGILELQAEISAPLVPPPTSSKTWPAVLSRGERYLGTVKKFADYGVFIMLPAGTDGLLRGSELPNSRWLGQLVAVEIVDIPPGKPIVLKRIYQ